MSLVDCMREIERERLGLVVVPVGGRQGRKEFYIPTYSRSLTTMKTMNNWRLIKPPNGKNDRPGYYTHSIV